MKFETKRLVLRYPKKSDWEDIVKGIGDIKVSKNIAGVPYPYKKKDALDWINKKIKESRKKKKNEYAFVIVLKENKKIIGVTEIIKIDKENKTAETGSWIARKYWRKGYITEAKIPILDFAFNKLKLRRLQTGVFKNNAPSNKMTKNLGYKKEGMLRKDLKCKATGKIHDANIYGLLKQEWKKRRKKLIKKLGVKK